MVKLSQDIESELGGMKSQVIAEAQEDLKKTTREYQKNLVMLEARLNSPNVSDAEIKDLKDKIRMVKKDIEITSRVLAEVDFEELNSV